VARAAPAAQEGPGLCGTAGDSFLPPQGVVRPAELTPAATAVRDPASVAAVYGNVVRSGAAAAGARAAAAAAALGAASDMQSVDSAADAAASDAAPLPPAGGSEDVGRVPPGYRWVLNAASAGIEPSWGGSSAADTGAGPGDDTSVDGELGSVPLGTPGAIVYDKLDGPPPGSKPAAASGFAGAADWAWDDPWVETPPAPADGGLVPDSPNAVHDSEVEAAAAAMPSVIRDADDPATKPPGAAAAASYGSQAGAPASPRARASWVTERAIGGGANDVVMDQAAVVARLLQVPTDLDAAAMEALGPDGVKRTAEATAAAVAAIVPPSYVTPLPPSLLDILREPSARDLAGCEPTA
jgi:hypothetical protein